MNIFKGLIVLAVVFGVVFVARPEFSYAGMDVASEMAQEEKDTGDSGELASLEPDAEEEQMIEDSQHGR